MDLFESKLETDLDTSAEALYTALENIRDMSLGIRKADDGQYQSELEAVALRLAYEGEFELNRVALSQGLRFYPKYLNETIPDPLEDAADTFRPGSKKAGAICTSGSCRG
jgi:hypothetical protein